MARNSSHPINHIGLEEFLSELVRTSSVNPPGLEGAVAVLMAARLQDLGFETTTVEAAPGRPNVIGRLPGSGGEPSRRPRGPYRRTALNEDPHFTNSGMADESVNLDDVARAAQIYAQLMIDLLGEST